MMDVAKFLETAHNNPVTITTETKLVEAAKILSAGTDIVIVCNSEGVLQGVVTKTDVVRQISVCQGATCMCPVSEVMSCNVVVCGATDPLHAVSALMKNGKLKNIPAVDDNNRPLAVLNVRAVLRALLSDAEYEEAQLVDYVKGVGYR